MSEVSESHPGIRVAVRHNTDADIVEVAGEIDMASATHLEEALGALTAPQLVIDLRQVEFMDSSGLLSLLQTQRRCEDNHGVKLLVQRPSPVLRLLELAEMTDVFSIEVFGRARQD